MGKYFFVSCLLSIIFYILYYDLKLKFVIRRKNLYIFFSADIKEDESTGQLYMKDDQSVSDWNTHKLETLTSLISIATNFCLWPVERQKSPFTPDLSDLFDDQHLRLLFRKSAILMPVSDKG